MPTVVGVRLRFSKTLWFDPGEATPAEGDFVVVNSERGEEMGIVVASVQEVEAGALPAPPKPIVRIATDEDLTYAEELMAKEGEALAVFRDMIEERKLDMKPVGVQFPMTGDKVTFYFSSDERVDFRDLVKELATRFHARIDMRQVGVRDEARAVGGIGHCGQMLCCVRFGGDFQPVSIRMAKEQDLPLNPLKISGLCGRLMCCLRYEYDAYKDFKSRAPKRGAIVETPAGLAKVAELNTPRETVRIRFEDGASVTVPLSGMECKKGGTCPCAVTAEALEAVAGPTTMVSAPEPSRPPRAAKPERGRSERSEKPAARDESQAPREGSGRRRRRRKSPEGGAQESAPATGGKQGQQAPKEAPKPAGDAGQPASDKPAKSGRRRRRRKPSGGGGGSAAPPA